MPHTKSPALVAALITALILAALALAGCGPGGNVSPGAGDGEPTMTAIPLPTRAPEELAGAQSSPTRESVETVASPSPTASPTLEPTTTPSPEPTSTASPTAEPTATDLSPTPTPTPTATVKPKASKPKPAPASQYSGKLVFQTTIGGDFYTINASGADSSDSLRRITDGVDPIWSPDGSQIAFTRWRQPRGVWVVDASGANERRLFDWNEARWPSWSPDGTEILFSRQHGGRTEEAERCFWGFCFDIPARPHWKAGIVQPADGAFYEPSAPNIVLAPTWSPDGDRFVYDGEQGLTIQTLDGEVSYLITDNGRDTGPAWSPDGSQVVFTRRQHDHWEVYVVDADGRNLKRLTDTPNKPDGEVGNSAAAAWSPDGQYLAFLTDRAGKWEIWVMKANGSGPKPMFPTALDGLTLEYSSVSERAISWAD